MRTTPPTIRPIKHPSPADDCAWVDHVRWQPQTLYNSTQLQDGLDTDLNVYTIGTVWNMCDWDALRNSGDTLRISVLNCVWRPQITGYEWSSAAAHVGEIGKRGQAQPAGQNPSASLRTGGAVPVLLDLEEWGKHMSPDQWREELTEGLTPTEMEALRLRTHTGRPLGSDAFLSKLETVLGRRVRPLPVGRPRNAKAPDPKPAKRRKYR